jgi:hypothetical protein
MTHFGSLPLNGGLNLEGYSNPKKRKASSAAHDSFRVPESANGLNCDA